MMRPLLALAGALVLSGCGNDTGIPHPDPLPDVALVRASALIDHPNAPPTGTVLVIGLPGCVAGKGTVTIETLGQITSASSTEQGTFRMEVTSSGGAMLVIRYQASSPVFKKVIVMGVTAPRPPEPIPGVPPLTDLGGGRFQVQGRTIVGPSAPLFGINPRTTEIAVATAGAGGAFQLELGAVSGDTLTIYDNEDPLEPGWSLPIP